MNSDDMGNAQSMRDEDDVMRDEDAAAEKEGKRLEKAGHTCVQYLETYPVQLRWCGEEDICANATYWEGPYGVRVPRDVTHCRAADGINTRSRGGGETEIGVRGKPPTKEAWLEKYAEKRSDGHYWLKPKDE